MPSEVALEELPAQGSAADGCPNIYYVAKVTVGVPASDMVLAGVNSLLLLCLDLRNFARFLASLRDRNTIIVLVVDSGAVR